MRFDGYRTREERVQEFIDACGGTTFEAVWNCLGEECLELQEAAQDFHTILDSNADDETKAKYRAAFVKEWADVQYVLSQVACFYNIDGEVAFNRVANNNMTKVIDGPDGSKKIQRREDGKILKPEGYEKPDMRGL